MLIIRTVQLQELGAAQPNRLNIQPCPAEASWIALRLVDQDEQPVAGAAYRLVLPDHSVFEGRLDLQGQARIEGIDSGSCAVSFPEFDGRDWRPI